MVPATARSVSVVDSPPSHLVTHPADKPQFTLIQALRGLAALWVVFFHSSEGGHVAGLEAALPAWLTTVVFHTGNMGVAIFFALSGFVIAHSLRGDRVDGRYIARFALRRSIRLDPPYWASMIFVVSLAFVSAHVQDQPFVPPTGPQVLAHLLYLQSVLDYPQIANVYWTLTYEVQFYLVLVTLTLLAQRTSVPRIALLALPLPLTLASIAGLIPQVLLFHLYWPTFMAGVLAHWAMTDRAALIALLVLVALLLGVQPSVFNAISFATALGLWAASRTRFLHTGLRWRWLQRLGTISYSLYLVHVAVLGAVFFVARKLGLPEAVGLAATLAACIAVAAAFWWLFERPSIALAHAIKLRAPTAPAPAPAPLRPRSPA